MAQSANTQTSPANYDFLMRRASAVYEAQFEVLCRVHAPECVFTFEINHSMLVHGYVRNAAR